MVDQFAAFANSTTSDRVCLSLDEGDSNVGTPGRLRLYGEASESDAELVGVSYNAAGRWDELDRTEHQRRLDALVSITDDAGVPGIWLGETDGKFGTAGGKKEIGEIENRGSLSCSPVDVEVDNLSQAIRDSFDSDATPPKTGQTYTSGAIDGFQEWAQGALGLVTIDIDVLGLNEDGAVHAFAEIKRTNKYDTNLGNWYPYTKGKRNDMRNYRLQSDTARRIGARPLVINHPAKGYLKATSTAYLYDLEGDQMNTIRKQGTDNTFTDDRFSYNRTKTTFTDALSVVIGDKNWV